MIQEFMQTHGYRFEPGGSVSWVAFKVQYKRWLASQHLHMTPTDLKAALTAFDAVVGIGPSGVALLGNVVREGWQPPRWVKTTGDRIRIRPRQVA